MAQTKHTRIITDEQFSETTTVDGTRIDRALEDTVSFFNSMPPSASKTRFIPQDRVWGWMPESYENGDLFDLIITTPGTGYTYETGDTPTVASLLGTGMTVDLAVTAGAVTGASINVAGTGYVAGEVITPARIVPTITVAGTGYSDATDVPVTTAGPGVGMKVDILTTGGLITRAVIRDCGTGYINGEVLSVPGGDGAGRITLAVAAGDCALTLTPRSKHHWPWLGTWNRDAEVAAGSSVPTTFLNDFRIKGTLTAGIVNKTPYGGGAWPLGSQFAWTTELFVGRPAMLDGLQLMLCQDHFNSTSKSFSEGSGATNFEWVRAYHAAGASVGTPHADMQVVVQVADTFDGRIRAKDSAEIQRHTFMIKMDSISWTKPGVLPLPVPSQWADMSPTLYPGGAIRGVATQLQDLNIPIHQNAIMRISVVIPLYADPTAAFWGVQPWNRQYYTMVATMLEEVE